MSCLFPGAAGVDTFWKNILDKHDSISGPPPDILPSIHYDPESTDTDWVERSITGWRKSIENASL